MHIGNSPIDSKHLSICQWKLLAIPSLSSSFSVTCVDCHMDTKCAWDSTAAGEQTKPRKWAPAGLKNASSEAQHQCVDAILFW